MGLHFINIANLFFSKKKKCPHCHREQRISVHESALYVKCEHCGKLIPLVQEPKTSDDDDPD